MAEASDVVRTRRLEIVDDEGNVRVVLGLLGPATTPDDEAWGVAVQDGRGHDRAWMVTVGDGNIASFGLDFEGDTVAALTVSDFGTVKLFMEPDSRSL